jgi:hypothetical protein
MSVSRRDMLSAIINFIKPDNVDPPILKLLWSEGAEGWVKEIKSREEDPFILLSFEKEEGKSYDWLRDNAVLPEKLNTLRKKIWHHKSACFIIFSYGQGPSTYDEAKRVKKMLNDWELWKNYLGQHSQDQLDQLSFVVKDFFISHFSAEKMREIAVSGPYYDNGSAPLYPGIEDRITTEQIKLSMAEKVCYSNPFEESKSRVKRLLGLLCDALAEEKEKVEQNLCRDEDFLNFLKDKRIHSIEDWKNLVDQMDDEERIKLRKVLFSILTNRFTVSEMKFSLRNHALIGNKIKAGSKDAVADELYEHARAEDRVGNLIHSMIHHKTKGEAARKDLSENSGLVSLPHERIDPAGFLDKLQNERSSVIEELSSLEGLRLGDLQISLPRCFRDVFDIEGLKKLATRAGVTNLPEEKERVAEAIWSFFEESPWFFSWFSWKIFSSKIFQGLPQEERESAYKKIAKAIQK